MWKTGLQVSGDLLYLESNGRERRRVGDDMSTVQYSTVPVTNKKSDWGIKEGLKWVKEHPCLIITPKTPEVLDHWWDVMTKGK